MNLTYSPSWCNVGYSSCTVREIIAGTLKKLSQEFCLKKCFLTVCTLRSVSSVNFLKQCVVLRSYTYFSRPNLMMSRIPGASRYVVGYT